MRQEPPAPSRPAVLGSRDVWDGTIFRFQPKPCRQALRQVKQSHTCIPRLADWLTAARWRNIYFQTWWQDRKGKKNSSSRWRIEQNPIIENAWSASILPCLCVCLDSFLPFNVHFAWWKGIAQPVVWASLFNFYWRHSRSPTQTILSLRPTAVLQSWWFWRAVVKTSQKTHAAGLNSQREEWWSKINIARTRTLALFIRFSTWCE